MSEGRVHKRVTATAINVPIAYWLSNGRSFYQGHQHGTFTSDLFTRADTNSELPLGRRSRTTKLRLGGSLFLGRRNSTRVLVFNSFSKCHS